MPFTIRYTQPALLLPSHEKNDPKFFSQQIYFNTPSKTPVNPEPKKPVDIRIGDIIVRVSQQIGKGASSTVYKAKIIQSNKKLLNQSTNSSVLKVIRLPLVYEVLSNVSQEIAIQRELARKNIAPRIFASQIIQTDTYNESMILMERGRRSLSQLININPSENLNPDKWELKKKGLLEIAKLILKTHEQGIVHSDLKPGNIILSLDGSLRLIDFGLSFKGFKKGAGKTILFAAPETILASPNQATKTWSFYNVGKSIDIWSFGAIIINVFFNDHTFTNMTYSDNQVKGYVKSIIEILGWPPEICCAQTDQGPKEICIIECSNNTTKLKQSSKYSCTRTDEEIEEKLHELFTNKFKDLIQRYNISEGEIISLSNLLSNIFQWNPSNRFNIEQVIQHDFFDVLPDPSI